MQFSVLRFPVLEDSMGWRREGAESAEHPLAPPEHRSAAPPTHLGVFSHTIAVLGPAL